MIRRKTSIRFKPSRILAPLLFVASTATAGPPFVTDDPEPVDYRSWEFYAFSQGTSAAHGLNGAAPSCDCNYGILPNVQLHLQPGGAFHHANGASLAWGPGDSEFGLKYRFIEQGESNLTPSVAFYPLLEAPTGDSSRGLGAGRTRSLLPLWVQRSIGDWTTFGGGGYWINPGSPNKNYWFVGWAAQRKVTDNFALGVELFHQNSVRAKRLAINWVQHRRDLRCLEPLPHPALGGKRPPTRQGNERFLLVSWNTNHWRGLKRALTFRTPIWRPRRESNPRTRICSPLRSHSATRPLTRWRTPFSRTLLIQERRRARKTVSTRQRLGDRDGLRMVIFPGYLTAGFRFTMFPPGRRGSRDGSAACLAERFRRGRVEDRGRICKGGLI